MDKSFRTWLDNNKTLVEFVIVIFYAVGVAGMLWQVSFSFFIRLIPFALLLSLFVLAVYHRGRFGLNPILVFLAIFVFGFVVEMWGVQTGAIFGQYRYAGGLGPKILDTPVIIGINWLLLVYTTSSVLDNVKLHPAFKVFFGAALMLVYDYFLEQAAPKMDMWHWEGNVVPLQNFIAWFIVALGFHALVKMFRVKTQNPMSLVVLVCQFLFFVVLSIALT